jgi:hypothetical protein
LYVLDTLKGLQLAVLNVLPFVYILLCSCQSNSAVIWLSNSPRERIGHWETCPILIGVHLAGASVTKTDSLLGVWRVTVSKVMLAYTNHEKATSAKRHSGQKSEPQQQR